MNTRQKTPTIRPLEAADLTWLSALNEACVPAVNGLDMQQLIALMDRAAWTGVAEVDASPLAVLIAFTKGSTYESTNYAWFNAQNEPFAYIDRVMVEPDGRALGLGRALYDALANWAKEIGQPRLCCEVNEVPPNPASLAFHKSLGFAQLTSRINPADGKQVAMLERRL